MVDFLLVPRLLPGNALSWTLGVPERVMDPAFLHRLMRHSLKDMAFPGGSLGTSKPTGEARLAIV
jgi:hypothetical protein